MYFICSQKFLGYYLFFFILEKPAKGRKLKEVCAVFRRVWEAVKRPFHCCDPNSVVCLTPLPEQDDSALMPAPSPFRITPTADTDPADPELVRLPGQVCEDVESLCVPGPSRTEQSDLANPESSPVVDLSSSDLDDGESSLLSFVISTIFYFIFICMFYSLLLLMVVILIHCM